MNTFTNPKQEMPEKQHIKLDTFNNKVINNYEIVDYDTTPNKNLPHEG